jgi:hypothetical protein
LPEISDWRTEVEVATSVEELRVVREAEAIADEIGISNP